MDRITWRAFFIQLIRTARYDVSAGEKQTLLKFFPLIVRDVFWVNRSCDIVVDNCIQLSFDKFG